MRRLVNSGVDAGPLAAAKMTVLVRQEYEIREMEVDMMTKTRSVGAALLKKVVATKMQHIKSLIMLNRVQSAQSIQTRHIRVSVTSFM